MMIFRQSFIHGKYHHIIEVLLNSWRRVSDRPSCIIFWGESRIPLQGSHSESHFGCNAIANPISDMSGSSRRAMFRMHSRSPSCLAAQAPSPQHYEFSLLAKENAWPGVFRMQVMKSHDQPSAWFRLVPASKCL